MKGEGRNALTQEEYHDYKMGKLAGKAVGRNLCIPGVVDDFCHCIRRHHAQNGFILNLV
ncbi:hypothetical protein VIBNIAM115_1980047 [Vibrio nigripulchritudo AM115]|nr:hypothetical protein VIBNIAM115_1980047 [Vibrio nigripulchritudo AM115]